MTLDSFEKKHKNLLDLGACKIIKGGMYTLIILDRFVEGGKPLCPMATLKPAQADAKKMGFFNVSVSRYVKRCEK